MVTGWWPENDNSTLLSAKKLLTILENIYGSVTWIVTNQPGYIFHDTNTSLVHVKSKYYEGNPIVVIIYNLLHQIKISLKIYQSRRNTRA